MESEFSRRMHYEEVGPRKVGSADVAPDTIPHLQAQVELSKSRMEEIAGQKILSIQEFGPILDIKLEDEEKGIDKQFEEEFRLCAERVMIFQMVVMSLNAGNRVVIGKDRDPSVKNPDQARLLIVEKITDKPKFIYTRLMFGKQAIDLLENIYPPKINSAGQDDREELRQNFISQFEAGKGVVFKPAHQFN